MSLLNLTDGGAKFRDRVQNPRVFKIYMLVKEPVLGVTGAYLDRIDTRRMEMVLPWGRATRNMFGGTFSSAIAAAAETTSAAMLVLHIRNQGAALQGDVIEIAVRQLQSVTQNLRIVCDEGERYADFVSAGCTAVPTEETFNLDVVDLRGELTHQVEIRWRLLKK